ncbi:hypothetical protein CW273_14375 [Escherichia coli]|nr:hypothetical protein CW273_14375 [Escherichia coli]PLB75693.1 hypothetical protein APX96_20850 [Escherichia coli]PWD24661.1 hypothetical protein APX97_20990 [Escherichia coli]PWD25817.1 hypothetical protein APX98_15780 [Escherichia coli]PWD38563.1 hypothetical protein APY00_00265 [Escherichia coli]
MFAGKKSAQIREILISESAWEEMTCLFAPSLSDSELNKINNYVDEYYKQWGKQYVRFNVNLKNQDTNNSSFSYGDSRFEKSQGSNWTFQE